MINMDETGRIPQDDEELKQALKAIIASGLTDDQKQAGVFDLIKRREAYLRDIDAVIADAESLTSLQATFADLIVEARRHKGWDQETLAEQAGLSRTTISRWESGLASSPNPAQVRAVCAALDIDPKVAAQKLGYS
jgi:ribosome-binding protein aMBF1 (putative translation factor)